MKKQLNQKQHHQYSKRSEATNILIKEYPRLTDERKGKDILFFNHNKFMKEPVLVATLKPDGELVRVEK